MFEVLAAALLVSLLMVLLTVRLRNARFNVLGTGLITILVIASAGAAWNYRAVVERQQPITDRPIEIESDGYVSSQTCQACHPREYATWHRSYHRTMTQVATPETVVGNFGVTIQFSGQMFHLQRRGDEFWVDLEDPDWEGEGEKPPRIERQVVLTTGSHHRQFYWFATGKSRYLAQLPFIYLMDEQRWTYRRNAFLAPPSTDLSMEAGVWNVVCIQCHTTHAQPMFEGYGNDIDSRAAEFGISCEACHGPAEQHVELNRDPQRRYQHHWNNQSDTSIVQPEHLSPQLSAQVCGQCHSAYEPYLTTNKPTAKPNYVIYHGWPYQPGQDLTETRLIVQDTEEKRKLPMMQDVLNHPTFMERRFWSDGMIRIAGREYNGLIETPCYTHGDEEAGIMTCLSCHNMHMDADDPRSLADWSNDQLQRGMEGNQACLQCHASFATNLQDHTHHEPDSTGSLCYNCHMPHTTYGLLKAIRSHLVDSPNVAKSVETGRPNACNLCHLNTTMAWSAQHLEEWYGIAQPVLDANDRSIAASVIWLLSGDAAQRALIAWSMGWKSAQQASGTEWMVPYLAQLLEDPYAAVRYITYRSLRQLPAYRHLQYDFDGPPEQGRQTAQQVRTMWEQAKDTTKLQTAQAVLIDAQGALDQDTLTHLLQQRDDRVIVLEE